MTALFDEILVGWAKVRNRILRDNPRVPPLRLLIHPETFRDLMTENEARIEISYQMARCRTLFNMLIVESTDIEGWEIVSVAYPEVKP